MATVTKPIALDESFNTTETPSRNIADVLASLGDAISQGAQPVTKKLATNSFKTINGGLVDGLTVQFAPVQDLHGQPKPWAGGAGKNQFDKDTMVINAYFVNNGEIQSFFEGRVIYAPCQPNTTYTISKLAGARFRVGTTRTLPAVNVQTYQGTTNENASSITITTDNDAQYIVAFVYHSSYDTVTADEMLASCQIEKGSTATSYAPYSNICPISGHTDAESDINGTTYTTSLGTTVYGGEVDQVSGDGESIYGFVTLDGSETWAESGTRGYIITASNSGIMDCKQASTANTWCLSNLFERGTSTWQNGKFGIDNRTIWVNDENYETYGGLASFKAMLSGSPLTVAYELATPTSLSVTGQLITAEVGVNNVSAPLDGQSIKTDSVIYKDMFTWEDVLKVI